MRQFHPVHIVTFMDLITETVYRMTFVFLSTCSSKLLQLFKKIDTEFEEGKFERDGLGTELPMHRSAETRDLVLPSPPIFVIYFCAYVRNRAYCLSFGAFVGKTSQLCLHYFIRPFQVRCTHFYDHKAFPRIIF